MKQTERNKKIIALWVRGENGRAAAGHPTQEEIAVMFGLSQTRVAFIISGKKNKYRMCQGRCGAHITKGGMCEACKTRGKMATAIKRLIKCIRRHIYRTECALVRRDAYIIISNMRRKYRDELRERRNFWSV